MSLLDEIKQEGLVVILRNVPVEDLENVARSSYRGGGRVFEVALNTPDAYEQIKKLKEIFKGENAIIGAGTVTNREKAIKAHEVGADFFLTPGLSIEVLDYAKDFNIPIIPGVFSPSEVQCCLERGLKVLKLFPANSLSLNYVKNLKGPYDEFDVFAVGGVSENNIKEFMDAGMSGVGMGSSLLKKSDITDKNWDAIENRVRTIKEQISLAKAGGI